MVPIASIDGQDPCKGCGFDAISRGLLSLLMKVTLEPTGTVTFFGLTPADVIVTVAPIGPTLPVLREMTVTDEGPPVELPPPPPPHAVDDRQVPRETTPTMKDEKRSRIVVIGQKNFREMLKPMYHVSFESPPRAI